MASPQSVPACWERRPQPMNRALTLPYDLWLLSGFGVVSIGLRDQGGDKSAEQGLSASSGIVDELEEAEVGR